MKPWSISALSSFETCPKKHYHTNVLKDVTEPPSEAMDWGAAVHKAFENYYKKGTPFPLGMRQFDKLAKQFGAAPGDRVVEQKLALTEDFAPTGWFGDRVWVRSVVDLAITHGTRALVIDWKTGRKKEDDDQLALMAACMFHNMEELQTVVAAFVWLQEEEGKQIAATTFERKDLPAIWERFQKREQVYQDAFEKTEFPPRPSGLCRRYCPVKKCPYWGG